MTNFDLLRDASVELNVTYDKKRRPQANITVNGQYEHTFPSTSRVSKQLESTDPSTLEARLNGGKFFVVDDQIVDFRYNDYNGFVHSDQAIEQLVEHVGISDRDQMSGIRTKQVSNNVILGTKWSDHQINVPMYDEGGKFNSELNYLWSPFHRNINTAFRVVRLICANGMVASTPILNARIPVINRWAEHLQIANRQIQNKAEHVLANRIEQMGKQRATVGELMILSSHAAARLEANNEDQSTFDRLMRIMHVADPVEHLSSVYTLNVFEDRRISAQVPGHLTAFDAYNIATELNTHTFENDKSTTNALERFANTLVFTGNKANRKINRQPSTSTFSNPDQAFFGTVAV